MAQTISQLILMSRNSSPRYDSGNRLSRGSFEIGCGPTQERSGSLEEISDKRPIPVKTRQLKGLGPRDSLHPAGD
jgi:hypothetical protein